MNNRYATALWHLDQNKSALQRHPIPDLREDQILLQSQFSLISSGTERLVAKGQVPEDLHSDMRVPGMEGSFLLPVKYGYSVVGKIISKCSLNGRYAHLLYPHQDLILTEISALSLLPEGLSPKRACLTSNMETALNAVWDSQVTIGDRVLICGFGIIGALVALVLSSMPAVSIEIAEKDSYRQKLAQQMGFRISTGNKADFDLSFNTSSSATGLQLCIDAVRREGKIIELSWYGKKEIQLQLGGSFHYGRKQLISSQVSHIPYSKSPHINFEKRKQIVFDLLKDPVYDSLITTEIPFSESPLFFEQLRNGKDVPPGIGRLIYYPVFNV